MTMKQASGSSVLRIGLAAVRNAPSIEERLRLVERFLQDSGERGVAIVCFPEAYLPGLRGMDFSVLAPDQSRQVQILERVRAAARRHGVATIIGMEWETGAGMHNVAFVISRDGEVQGYQAKNQIPPQEEPFYVPDGRRRLFDIDGVPFGIAICHEGWRYPETVRWAAVRGARVVFHPQLTGSDHTGATISRWGDPDSPYYEKAMIARGIENTVYFASINCAMRYQESATSLLGPEGELLGHIPYGEEQLMVYDIDVTRATGFSARRFDPSLLPQI